MQRGAELLDRAASMLERPERRRDDVRDTDLLRGEHASTYWSLPVLKAAPWKAYIPIYLYVGGITGASAVLAATASLRGDGLRAVVHRARWLAAGGAAVSAALLIADLGRPKRFLYMLRVFRPTSPMSMGTWILTPLGLFASVAALASGRRSPVVARLGDAAGLVSGALGLPMSGYTAVLLANTAVPVWTRARHTLPWLLVASSVSSTGALLEAMPSTSRRSLEVLRRFSFLGRVAKTAAAMAVERELGRGRVGAPLRRGLPGLLWRTAKLLGLASIALASNSRHRSTHRALGTMAATLDAICLRFALVHAGRASAHDPRATLSRSTVSPAPREPARREATRSGDCATGFSS